MKSGPGKGRSTRSAGAAQASYAKVLNALLDCGYDDFEGGVVGLAASKGCVLRAFTH